jgi:hypothetical protein
MGASQSNLSAAGYGYDLVLATTQASINTQMKTFLSMGSMPVVNICYVADAKGNPTPIDYETLKKNAKGSDPFLIPDGVDPSTNQDFKNLFAARFMVGFRAQIGLPPGYAPAAIPDVVTLGADTASVIFNLMCSEFIAVQLNPGGGFAPASWMNQSQPDGNAWLFTSKVDMRMFATDQSKYNLLPPAVQQQIANLGGDAFSVQQLLFDLDNAALESIPVMSGVKPGTTLYTVLQTDFLGAYFAAMQASGSPILGCAITQAPSDPSPLVLSNLQFQVSPLLNADGSPIPQPTPAQQQLATLGYLCEADNGPPIAPRAFGWNWIDPSDASQGVVAVNRNTFAGYFRQQLTPFVMRNCYLPYTRVWLSGFFDQNVHFAWNMTPYQTPTVTAPPTGSTVLQYHWSGYAEDQAGLNGDMGHLTLSTTMDCSVQFTGNTIVITQHLVVYLYVKVLATGAGANVIDKQITDTYTLSVTGEGQIVSSPPSTAIVDNSSNPSTNGFLNFFADAQAIINSIDGWISTYVATNLTDIPLSTVQGFIFPGGDTFAFHDAIFSNNQDLTGTITYGAPGTVHLSTREMIAGVPGPRGSMPVTRAS